jgi:protein-S-isoprenylcysteine O-methyltransferase Ste14
MKKAGGRMNIKGFDELRGHFPDLNTPGGRLRIALTALAIFALTTIYFLVSDQIPTWTIDSEIVVMTIGFLLFSLFFVKRSEYLEKYGDLAYRNAFVRFAIPGLAVLFAAIGHIAYMNGPKWPPGTITTLMAVLGTYWVIVGIILWIRTVLTFGVDYLTMLYVYFPEKGHIARSRIYDILRHPIYAAAMRIGLGLALLNTSIYALVFMPFLPLGLYGFVHLVEEKELLARFPDYAEYRKRVPAFWTKPKDIGRFWKFLLTGE